MEDEEFHANMYGHAYTVKKEDEKDSEIKELKAKIKNMDWLKNHDYKWLVNENKRLENENHRIEQQYLEVMADNKKLAQQIEDKINQMRKSGVL